MSTKVADDGTILIPGDVVARAGLRAGDAIDLMPEGLSIRVACSVPDVSSEELITTRRARLAKWIGFLGDDGLDGRSVDEFIEEARGR